MFDRQGWSRELFDDLLSLNFDFMTYRKVSEAKGFVARGMATDGKSHYAMGSNDQTGPWLFGLWRYLESGLPDKAERLRIVARVIETVEVMIELNWRKVATVIESPMIDVREHLRKRIDEARTWHADGFPGTAFSPFAEMLRGTLCKISPDRYIDNGEFLVSGKPRKQRFGVRFLVQPGDQPDVVFYVDVLLAPDWEDAKGPVVKVKSVDPKDKNQVDPKHDIISPHVKAGDCNKSEPVDTFFKRWLRRAFSEEHDKAEKILDYPCERTRADQACELSCDLEEIRSRDLDTTAREALVQARLGQGTFRKDVLAMWGQQCCVTGVKTLAAVRASHIKPWCESSDEERLDEMNGLPLVATLDALFDAGLITFTDEGVLLVQQFPARVAVSGAGGGRQLLGCENTEVRRSWRSSVGVWCRRVDKGGRLFTSQVAPRAAFQHFGADVDHNT